MKRTRVLLSVCALLAATVAAAIEKSQTIVYINGAKYYIHTVQKGETLYALSKLYGVGEPVILASNPEMTDGLKADANIKIPVIGDVKPPKAEKRLKKTFDSHYVASGETLYGISRKYEISVDTILEDNPDLDPLHLSIGQRILIRKSEKGESSAARNISELEEYKDNLNSVSQGDAYSYHLVH
ncbi:MAG: LysM peptidoglycan-binding domain-containing protein, partial [Alistipes sp.]|nr:LysM peptidoglycan-binding domain-containing protein [Alistipes sp.]